MQDSLVTPLTTPQIGIRIKPLTLNSIASNRVLLLFGFFYPLKDTSNRKRYKLKCYKRDFPNIDINDWG